MKSLEKLMYTVALVDKVSGPVSRIDKSIGGLASNARAAFSIVGGVTAGLAGAGYALYAGLQPAIEMQRALGNVKSLDVHGQALAELENRAIAFSTRYGKSASDFVAASYDIQSAIAGLKNAELASFTEASAVLASATLADTQTVTAYMGTMYGIFKNQAAAMGNDNWVKIVAGQTANAVQMFKTTGAEMSAAFTSLGADAASVGVAMSEQMAILGTLQATMSGSEAGTKYRAFLAGTAKAQQALGLSFTDASGNILPMVDVLDKLRGKYGDTLNVAESAELSKAFGTQEAVGMIKLLMADTDGLNKNISKLGSVTGMEKALTMADAISDPWERLGASMTAIRINMGEALLPAIEPVINAMSDGAAAVAAWAREYPNLTRTLSIVGVVMAGVASALIGLAAAEGIASVASRIFAVDATLAGAALNFLFSPVTLIVGGLALLVGGVIAMVYWWDSIKASLNDTGWGQTIVFALESIGSMFMQIWRLTMTVADVLFTAFSPLIFVFEKIAYLVGAVLKVAFIGVVSVISMVIGGFAKLIEGIVWGITKIFEGFRWLEEKAIALLDKIPGINIGGGDESQLQPPRLTSLDSSRSDVPSGGVGKTITNALSKNSTSNVHIEKIETKQPAVQIEQELLLAGA